MASNNRSQVYLDANDNISKVINQISDNVNKLNSSLSKLGGSSGNSFDKMNSSLNTQMKQLKDIDNSVKSIGDNVLKTSLNFVSWGAALYAIKGIGEGLFGFFKKGIEVTIDTQTARNGIAGLIASLYNIKDASGNIQKGPEAFATALKLADEDVRKLRLDALNTGANFKELRDGYTQALGPGAQLGFSRDQTRNFSTIVANAAKAMGMQKGMVGQEIRALLTNKIDKNATIGTNLGFGPGGALKEQYENAIKAGNAYEFLMEQLDAYSRAGEEQAKSLGGTFDALGDVFDQFTMESSDSLAKSLNKIRDSLAGLYDSKSGEFTEKLTPIVAMFNTIGETIGDSIVGGINNLISYVEEFGVYLTDNQQILNSILETSSLIGDVFVGIIDIFATLYNSAIDIIYSVTGIGQEADSTNEKFNSINTTLQIITGFVGALNIAIGLIKDTVVIVADSIRILIGGAIQFVMNGISSFVGHVSNIANGLGLSKVSNDLNAVSKSASDSVSKFADKVVGSNNKILNAPNIGASFSEKNNHFFSNTIKALDKSAESFNKAQSTENKTFKNLMKSINDRKKLNAIGNDDIDTSVKNKNKGKEKKEKGGKDDGKGENENKLAYESELKELERLNKREKDLNSNKIKELELDRQYNLIGIKSFFEEKNKIREQDYLSQLNFINKELQITEEQKRNALTSKDLNKLNDKENELINKKNKLEQEYSYNKKKDNLDQLKQLREYAHALSDLNAQILEMTGKKSESRTIKLNIEHENNTEKYKSDPEALSKINELYKLKLIQEQFNSASEDFNLILDKQSIKEERINILQQNGRISELDHMNNLKDIRMSYIDQLSEQIKKLNDVYEVTKDPSVLNSIDKLKNKMLELELTVDPLKDKFNKLFEDGLTNAFVDFIDGTKSASDAFRDFSKSIEKELLKLASQQVIKQIAGSLFGSDNGKSDGFGGIISSIFGGSKSSAAEGSGIFDTISNFIGGFFASGGSVKGDKPIVVGEGGPELFFPSSSGYIMNTPMSNSFASSKGGSSNIIQNITISTPNYSSFNNSDNQIGVQMANALSRAKRNM